MADSGLPNGFSGIGARSYDYGQPTEPVCCVATVNYRSDLDSVATMGLDS